MRQMNAVYFNEPPRVWEDLTKISVDWGKLVQKPVSTHIHMLEVIQMGRDAFLHIVDFNGDEAFLTMEAVVEKEVKVLEDKRNITYLLSAEMRNVRLLYSLSIIEPSDLLFKANPKLGNRGQYEYFEFERVESIRKAGGRPEDINHLPFISLGKPTSEEPINNLTWQVGFRQSLPLLTAEWNDANGLQALIDLLVDRDKCDTLHALLNPVQAKENVEIRDFQVNKMWPRFLAGDRRLSEESWQKTIDRGWFDRLDI